MRSIPVGCYSLCSVGTDSIEQPGKEKFFDLRQERLRFSLISLILPCSNRVGCALHLQAYLPAEYPRYRRPSYLEEGERYADLPEA